MSSWERSRRIPWTKIQQGPNAEDPEVYRERHFEEMRKMASIEAEEKARAEKFLNQGNEGILQNEEGSWKSKILRGQPYSNSDLFRQLAFGGCVGVLTGATFGFMDSMRQASDSVILKRASNTAKGRFLLQGTSRSALLFGTFFSSFHALKYGVRVVADPGPYTEIGVASIVSTSILIARPATRQSFPYAVMLILMDTVSWIMKENS